MLDKKGAHRYQYLCATYFNVHVGTAPLLFTWKSFGCNEYAESYLHTMQISGNESSSLSLQENQFSIINTGGGRVKLA